MRKWIFCSLSALILFLGGCFSEKNMANSRRKLVWSDEFNYAGMPDSAKWGYDTGDGCPRLCGWGNNERQYYTANRLENARVENGNLVIEAHRESMAQSAYTSARLVSKGKGDWTYGRFEIRAQLPHGRGIWPAIWMLPTHWEYGGWPESGEIDIMEYVGFEPDSIYGTVHTGNFNGMKGTQKTGRVFSDNHEAGFRVYALEWTPEYIDFFVDNQRFHRFANTGKSISDWPFNRPFHLVLNVAVGGNWGGKKGVDDAIFPQKMLIDYVRVYQ